MLASALPLPVSVSTFGYSARQELTSDPASLRAYGAEDRFVNESMIRINRYTRAARTFYNLNRWICIRVDAISGLFAAGLAGYLLHFRTQGASNMGFSLNMAGQCFARLLDFSLTLHVVGFSSQILWWIRVLNDFEVAGNSLERIEQYITIEQEPKPSESGEPPAYWPASGSLAVEGLSAKYSEDGPKVLHEIRFEARAGERIGIGTRIRLGVGRFQSSSPFISWPHWLWQKLVDPGPPSLHTYRRKGPVRWARYQEHQLGCSPLSHHHHTPST